MSHAKWDMNESYHASVQEASLYEGVAVCYGVMQFAAMCCSVLQCGV